MTEAPDTSIIERYLEDLAICKKEAQRVLDVKNAAVNQAKAEYARAFSNLAKFKIYWDKIETTKIKGDLVELSFDATLAAIDSVEGKLKVEIKALTCLTQEAIILSNQIEKYATCLEELIQKIDRLSNSKIDKNNPVIKALRDLYAAYEAALACAQTAIKELLLVLEQSYVFQRKLEGRLDTAPTCIDHEQLDGYGTDDDNDPSTHSPIQDGLAACVMSAFDLFCKTFPLFRITADDACELSYEFPREPDDIDCDCESYQKFVSNTYNQLNAATSASNEASRNLSVAVQEKNEAQSQKEAIEKSLEAAKAAKAC